MGEALGGVREGVWKYLVEMRKGRCWFRGRREGRCVAKLRSVRAASRCDRY